MNERKREQGARRCLLHVVSIFPSLTETFVLRDVRELIRLGWNVVLGQLRPVGRRPTAPGFDDLRPHVTSVNLLSIEMLEAFAFYVRTQPQRTWVFMKITLRSVKRPCDLLKIIYILVASMQLAHRFRNSRIMHASGHHLHSEALAAMFIAGFLGIPYSFKCHTVKLYYPESVISEVVRRAKFIVADTLEVRAFLQTLGAHAGKIRLIRNGVRLSEFSYRSSQRISAIPIILAVGRLDYKKGFHVLLRASALLRDRGVRFKCVIVGDGSERRRLEALKKQLRLHRQIDMVGNLGFTDLQSLYQRATMLVVPSVVEPDGSIDGLPTVVTEAFAMGVPVIGAKTAAIPEVVRHGVSGFLVPANSAGELAHRIADLLENEELRIRFAGEGRKLAEQVFDLEGNCRILSALIVGQEDLAREPAGRVGSAFVSWAEG